MENQPLPKVKASDVRHKLYGDHDVYENVQLLELDVQAWNPNEAAFEKCIQEIQPKIIVEVGTWKGWSAMKMAEICLRYYDDFQIICVDTWLGSVEHWLMEFQADDGQRIINVRDSLKNGRCQLYELFLSNVVQKNMQKYITPFAIDSINAAYTLFNLGIIPDLVYIDAGHEYESVKLDLAAYSSLLRVGGYMLGDDWHHPPIKRAVNNTFNGGVVELSEDKFLWVKGE